MVVPLRPGKFYGTALPRPRFYEDVKHSPDGLRVNPPLPVLDPLLSWARDAHWSMGGLSFLRRRLQGRIEGSLRRLRAQQERKHRLLLTPSPTTTKKQRSRLKKAPPGPVDVEEEEIIYSDSSSSSSDEEGEAAPRSVDRPRRSVRKRRLVGYEEEEEEEEEEVIKEVEVPPKKRARKLGDEFDKVASAGAAMLDGGSPSEGKRGASPPSVGKGRSKEVGPSAPRRSSRISPNKRSA